MKVVRSSLIAPSYSDWSRVELNASWNQLRNGLSREAQFDRLGGTLDHAVSLVQAYLQLNGYFTSAEYPVISATGGRGFRTLTDIDILAFRFPLSASAAAGNISPEMTLREPDPGLGVPPDRIDMIIGEVKEGKVNINSGATEPEILRAVVRRFGCGQEETDILVRGLLESGSVTAPSGYQIRLIAFGAFPPGAEVPPCRIISLGHVLRFLQDYVREHWAMLRHCQFKDPAFGFLMTLEKARRGGAGRRGEQGVEIVPAASARSVMANERRGRGPTGSGNGRAKEVAPTKAEAAPSNRPVAKQRPLSGRRRRSPKRRNV